MRLQRPVSARSGTEVARVQGTQLLHGARRHTKNKGMPTTSWPEVLQLECEYFSKAKKKAQKKKISAQLPESMMSSGVDSGHNYWE
jgi:hypothetical protein